MKTKIILTTLYLTAAFLPLHTVMAAENGSYTIEMKDGAFKPSNLEVPANQKIHLVVKNSGTSQAEFESYPLNQEQKIESGESTDIYVGPLDPGEYPIFDDNNPDAKGNIVAK